MKMKYLILAFLTFGVLSSKSLTFTVTAQSFADSSAVAYGSAQWIDVKTSGGYTSSDHLTIYLAHYNNGNTSNYIQVFDQVFFSYWPTLPTNADGSKRIYFNMPAWYETGYFELSVNLGPFSLCYGEFQDVATEVPEIGSNKQKEVLKISYFDELGRNKVNANGLFYEEIIFTDGSRRIRKIYKIE